MAGLDLAEFISMEQTTPSLVGTSTLSNRRRSISRVGSFWRVSANCRELVWPLMFRGVPAEDSMATYEQSREGSFAR
jgi:hypothetical protein